MESKDLILKIMALLKEEFYFSEEDFNINGKFEKLEDLKKRCLDCKKCSLYETANNLVFSDGDFNSKLVFVGEAPGEEEDIQGKPFVGRAGRLLTSVLQEMGVERESVYICNVLKHRPPGNRNPTPEEITLCSPFLLEQLAIIKPVLIVALGNFSSKFLLNTEEGVSRLRGVIKKSHLGYDVLPTFHPAAVLRNINYISDFKSDIKKAIDYIRGKN